jgi:hypothetical protein
MTDQGQHQTPWRRELHWRTPDWCHETGVYWESWSLNGEVCLKGLDPPFAGRVRRAWESGLDALAEIDGAACTEFLDEDEHAFLLNMLALVHARSGANVRPRPPLEESYRRHEGLIAELAPPAQAKGLPVQ